MSTQVSIPDYVAGTWVIDSARSQVSFVGRLLGFAKVRGRFDDFEGTIVLAESPLDSSVSAVINTASVNTKNKKRDDHLRHDDFMNAEKYPTMAFTSTGVRAEGDHFLVDGDLTLREVTKQVTLSLQLKGFDSGAGGKASVAFTATTEINGTEFGVTRGKTAPYVGAKHQIVLDIVATRQD
jgi:polyisoprenoid-binding protein YceI